MSITVAGGGTPKYAEVASSPLGATAPAAFTLSAWHKTTSTPGLGTILGVGGSSGNNYIALLLGGSGDVLFECNGLTSGTAGVASANTWTHVAGVQSTTTFRAAYKNGVAGSANTATIAPGVLIAATVGGLVINGTRLSYSNGDTAHAAIWNVALTDVEVAALAKGFSPLLIRPQNLVFYAPLLDGGYTNYRGSGLLVPGAGAAAPTKGTDNPPTFMPQGVRIPTRAVVVPAGAALQPITAPQSFSQSTAADPWTFSVTVDKGPNRALVAIVMLEGNGVTGDRSVVDITYDGLSLYKLDDQDAPTWGACEMWVLNDPPVGTANLVVDLNAADVGVCAVVVGQKVDESVTSARLRTSAKTSGTGTSATVTVSGVTSDDLVISALHINGTGHTAAPGPNETELVDRASTTGANEGVVNKQLGVDGGAMSNTWTTSAPYALIGTAFQGAPPKVATGYSEFLGAGSATVDQFRIPGIDVSSGDGFIAYALVRPTGNLAVRSMSILEFRSSANVDSVLLEIDSGGYYAWSNQSGTTLGDSVHAAVQDLWTLVVWEKKSGGFSDVNLHICEDPGGTPAWSHYTLGQDTDPDETADGIVSVSNFDFLALEGHIACWGAWNTDWLEGSGTPDADLEATFSGFTTAGLLASAHPPFAHFELNDQGYAPDLAGNGAWHDWSTAQVVSDTTVPWGFAGAGTSVSAVRMMIVDALAAVAGARIFPFDAAAQIAGAARSSAWEAIAQIAGVRNGVLDAQQGIGAARAVPYDAAASVAATSTMVWEALSSATPVTATAIMFLDAIQSVAGAAQSAPWDALAQLASTRSTAWDALQGVTGTRTAPYEATAALAIARTVAYEALGGVTSTSVGFWDGESSLTGVTSFAVMNVDAIATVLAAAAGNYEALAQLQGTARTAPYETLAGVAGERTSPWEAIASVGPTALMAWEALATGLTPVNAIAVMAWDAIASVAASLVQPYEATAGLRAVVASPYEAQADVQGARSLAWDALGGVVATVQANLDSTGTTQLQAALSWDATAQVAGGPRTFAWESQLGLVRAVPMAYDALGGLSVVAVLPWEADGLDPIPPLNEPLRLRVLTPDTRLVATASPVRLATAHPRLILVRLP